MLITTMRQEIDNENLYAELDNELLSPSVELDHRFDACEVDCRLIHYLSLYVCAYIYICALNLFGLSHRVLLIAQCGRVESRGGYC